MNKIATKGISLDFREGGMNDEFKEVRKTVKFKVLKE